MMKSRRQIHIASFQGFSRIVFICISLGLFASAHAATFEFEDDDSLELFNTSVVKYKIDDQFRIRGWKFSPEVYFGNAKVNGVWGLGLVVDKKSYAYGINNRQAAVVLRF